MASPINNQSVTFQGKVDGGTAISVSVNLLPATEDCLRVVLHERVKTLSYGPLALAWTGIAITIAITLATASFHSLAGFSADFIAAFFLLALIVSAALAVVYSIKLILKSSEASVDGIVNEIKRRSKAP